MRVLADGVEVGTLEGAYAERLQAGDRFVLDGRGLEFRRLEGLTAHARASGGDEPEPARGWSGATGRASPPNWPATLPGSAKTPRALLADGPEALRAWLREGARPRRRRLAEVLVGLFEAQEQLSEVPAAGNRCWSRSRPATKGS